MFGYKMKENCAIWGLSHVPVVVVRKVGKS